MTRFRITRGAVVVVGVTIAALLAAVGVASAAHTPPQRPHPSPVTKPPVNACHAVVEERAAWPLSDQARAVVNCTQVADFTEVRAKLHLPLQADVFTPWFSDSGVTYRSQWVHKNTAAPIPLAPGAQSDWRLPSAHLEFRSHGSGVALYGLRRVDDRQATFQATLPSSATGTVELRDVRFGMTLASAPAVVGLATLMLPGRSLSNGPHELVAIYTGDATYPPAVSAPFLVTAENSAGGDQ